MNNDEVWPELPEPVALTLEALKELVQGAHRAGVHVWIRGEGTGGSPAPAVAALEDGESIIAHWHAPHGAPYLTEANYGELWLAYLDEPTAAEWGDFGFTDDIFENGRE